MRVLFCEDESDLNSIVTKKLCDEGYSVDSFLNGCDALDALETVEYDVAILDIMMPGANGYDVLKRIRELYSSMPVLFLTAKDSIQDKVQGLDSGANDYLVKPFSFEELMARLRVLTRNKFGVFESVITVADLSLDIRSHTVKRAGQPIKLSSKEFALLNYLMHNKGTVLTREQIEDHIWNFDYEGGTNVVDVYIRYIRKKIDDPFDKKLIHTIRAVGYVLREE